MYLFAPVMRTKCWEAAGTESQGAGAMVKRRGAVSSGGLVESRLLRRSSRGRIGMRMVVQGIGEV